MSLPAQWCRPPSRVRALVLFVGVALAAASQPAHGQWTVRLEVGAARYSGSAREIAPDLPEEGQREYLPYKPVATGLRLERAGRVRLGLSLGYGKADLALVGNTAAVLVNGTLSHISVAPEVGLRLATLGAQNQLHASAGPTLDLWDTVGSGYRAVLGGQVGLSLTVPLGRGISWDLRARVGLSGSMFEARDMPPEYRTRSMASRMVTTGVGLQL